MSRTVSLPRVPPPALLVLAIVLAAGVGRVDPTARPSSSGRLAGGALAVAGLAVALAGVAALRRRRTTVDPRDPSRASALVTDGVYRWTRNPMYLGLVVIALGATAALGSALALVGPVALAAYLDHGQIPAEERALRERFGAAFEEYAHAVRRWVGRRGPPTHFTEPG